MSHEADLDTALTHLAALAGDWDGTEHLSDTPWTTRGSASGSHKLRLATGGLTLVQDYQQRRRGAITLPAMASSRSTRSRPTFCGGGSTTSATRR